MPMPYLAVPFRNRRQFCAVTAWSLETIKEGKDAHMTKRTFVLLALFVGLAAVVPVARGVMTRQVGGFTAQVPENRTAPPRRPSPPPVAPGTRRLRLDSIEVLRAPTLASLLQPTDHVLEIVYPVHGITDIPNATPEEAADQLTAHNALATVRLLRKESALTAAGNQIHTTWTVDVIEVLKDSTGRLVAGSPANLIQFGGEVTIGNQRVIVHSLDLRPLQVGRIYLAAVDLSKDQLLFTSGSIEMEGNTARALRLDYPSPVTTRSADWIKQEVRRRVGLR